MLTNEIIQNMSLDELIALNNSQYVFSEEELSLINAEIQRRKILKNQNEIIKDNANNENFSNIILKIFSTIAIIFGIISFIGAILLFITLISFLNALGSCFKIEGVNSYEQIF